MIIGKTESGNIVRKGGREREGKYRGSDGKQRRGIRDGGGREDRGRRQSQADARLSSLSLCRTTTISGLRA